MALNVSVLSYCFTLYFCECILQGKSVMRCGNWVLGHASAQSDRLAPGRHNDAHHCQKSDCDLDLTASVCSPIAVLFLPWVCALSWRSGLAGGVQVQSWRQGLVTSTHGGAGPSERQNLIWIWQTAAGAMGVDMLFCGWTLTPEHAVEARDESGWEHTSAWLQGLFTGGHGNIDQWWKAGPDSVHKQQCVAGKEGRGKERLAGHTFTCGYRLLFYQSVAESCPTICDPMDCGPPNFSVCEISWARILEWVAISFFRGSSPPRDRTCVSFISRQILYTEAPGKPLQITSTYIRGFGQYILPPKAYGLKRKSVFLYSNMILYEKILMSHQNLKSKVEENEINIQKTIVYLQTKKRQSNNDIKEAILFMTA